MKKEESIEGPSSANLHGFVDVSFDYGIQMTNNKFDSIYKSPDETIY